MAAPVSFTSSVLGPRDRGIELGERFASEIAATAGAYRRLFVARAGGRPFDVDLWAERAWNRIARTLPPYAEEIAGIAEGAALPVREVAAINARTEILVAANPTGVNECSSVVCAPPGRPPYAVQTWDWYHPMSDTWFVWRFAHPDGRRVETVTEYGMLAKIGVNDRGLAVMLNMLHHASDETAAAGGEVGHPVHLLSRRILDEAGTLADADAIVGEPGSATTASTALTVLDRSGAAATLELFPHGPGRLDLADGVLARTNSFVSPEGEPGDLAHTINASSALRLATLRDALRAGPAAEPTDVLDLMHDHAPAGEVGGICAHPDTSMDPALWHRTLATVVLEVDPPGLDARPDGPCGHRDPRLAPPERAVPA